ncbi:RNA polymerase sigma factor [Nonomuraea sp. NPDC003201]
MSEDLSVVALVHRVCSGDQDAWDTLVERYSPLVWAICLRHGLAQPEAEDVVQTVWLALVEQVHLLREPAALPGWLVTATRRECARSLELARPYAFRVPVTQPSAVAALELAERNAALLAGFRGLDSRCRQLLSLLVQDPPMPYSEISEKLDMPVGAIGPTRARCLAKLRRCPEIVALVEKGD